MHSPLFSRPYLRGLFAKEFDTYLTDHDADVRASLSNWAARIAGKETTDESSFFAHFFVDLWEYRRSGSDGSASHDLHPQYPVTGAGASGGTGQADLALGNFGDATQDGVPQVLCEFKDIRSGLDAPQSSRADHRSPVEQALAYLDASYGHHLGRSSVLPTWGLVTDMNEFRLYYRERGTAAFERFVIADRQGTDEATLLGDDPASAFERFLFRKMFGKEFLITGSGRSKLEELLQEQWVVERQIEKDFYLEYRDFRAHLFAEIRRCNPNYDGTPGRLVRLTQRLLDRLIFCLFCEDMGGLLGYPQDLIRKLLSEYSRSSFYDPDGNDIWAKIKDLFTAMNNGGTFAGEHINRFNGGLFEPEPDLEALSLPASVFCARNQAGGGREKLDADKKTLLYLSASYNFGITGSEERPVIDLVMLGRIFEQSITELEIMEAEAEGRPSVNLLSKRKRDGVYYTPAEITDAIVRRTVGGRLDEFRREVGLADLDEPTEKEIDQYRRFLSDKRRKGGPAARYLKALDEFSRRLDSLTVVDPACGSGAFLVQVMRFLLEERRTVADLRSLITGMVEVWEQETVYRAVLSKNIFGVDINPESVEITKLALWLHTALPGKALTSLDRNIRCGNSLVGPDFAAWYRHRHATLFEDADEQERERINAFDWQEAFPDVFARGGFDCVVGNPPYVKLQNFRKVESNVAEYLVAATREDGSPRFRSTQTGNFDLYLPFIEAGIDLLADDGRMGYIAPNLWLKNEYGEGLRDAVSTGKHLDLWVDFGSYQVFEDATTYTALQYYTKRATEGIRFVDASDGTVTDLDGQASEPLDWGGLPSDPTESWILVSPEERAVMEKMEATGERLDSPKWTTHVFQGIITSADSIYHLQRIGANRYLRRAGKKDESEHEIEDALMRPLVSGPEAKRYREPRTDTYLLFPYAVDGEKSGLIPAEEMAARFPEGWAYLKEFEEELRGRERGKMDKDEKWWGYVYPKNLAVQHLPKLIAPRLVQRLSIAADEHGAYWLDNVDVGGIVPTSGETTLPFLLGILNSAPASFYWWRVSKPFRGDYRAANKQFIAPIPIPDASSTEQKAIAAHAEQLQQLHTSAADNEGEIARRLSSGQCVDDVRDESWIWSDVRASWKDWKNEAPEHLKGKDRSNWARAKRAAVIAEKLDPIDVRLRPGASFSVRFESGELSVSSDGTPFIDGIYVDNDEGVWIAAQWRHLLRNLNVTPSTTAASILGKLLSLRQTENAALRSQIIDLDRTIEETRTGIDSIEQQVEQAVADLYGLSEADRRLIDAKA